MKLIWLMLAGALGAAARYGLTEWLQRRELLRGTTVGLMQFPLGTLVVNVLGTFLLAMLVTLTLQGMVKPEWRLILGTGFLGAFTTFSTFELEAESLISNGQWSHATFYILGNLVLGFIAIFAGRFLILKLINAPV